MCNPLSTEWILTVLCAYDAVCFTCSASRGLSGRRGWSGRLLRGWRWWRRRWRSVAASLASTSRCVFFVQGVVPLWQLWGPASIDLGRPVGDTNRCVWSVRWGGWGSRGATCWRSARRWSRLCGAERGGASVWGRWERFLSAVRGGRRRWSRCFLTRSRWSIATATLVEGWRRGWGRGAVLHPAACGGAAAAWWAGDVRERGAVWVMMLLRRGFAGWGGRGGAAWRRPRGCGPESRGSQGRSAHWTTSWTIWVNHKRCGVLIQNNRRVAGG